VKLSRRANHCDQPGVWDARDRRQGTQLEVGDRVKILDSGEDDEGTVLDVDERTEMVIVYLGRHVGGWAFHRADLRKVRAH
jgi:hypothetical protein